MASSLVYLFLLSLCTIPALASLSPERTTNEHHLRGSRHPPSSLGTLRPRDSGCIMQYGVIKVTSTTPALNGYLAPPQALKDGAYGLLANNSKDALKVSYCNGGTPFDIVALNGPFAESGYPAIGGVQRRLDYQDLSQTSAMPAYVTLAGMEQGIQGPPKPANHTFHGLGGFSFDAQSTMWTIDNTKGFMPHWEDAHGNPVPVELGHVDFGLRPGGGPRFIAMQDPSSTRVMKVYRRVDYVNFVFVPN